MFSSRCHDLTSCGYLARFAVQSIDSFLIAGFKSNYTALFAPIGTIITHLGMSCLAPYCVVCGFYSQVGLLHSPLTIT